MAETRTYHKTEDNVKKAIADCLNRKYPAAPFRMEWDHIKLPARIDKYGNRYSPVGKKLKQMRWAEYGFVWPDCHVVYPTSLYHGLFLEIKKNRAEIYKIDGSLREDQQTLREQKSLEKLTLLGFKAVFTWSIDHAILILSNYFEGVD